MTNAELRALAEESIKENEVPYEWFDDPANDVLELFPVACRFIAACSPEVVYTLLDDSDRLAELRDWVADADHHRGCSGEESAYPCKCGLREIREGTR